MSNIDVKMVQLKLRFLKKIVRKLSVMFENMEPPATDLLLAIEAPAPIYTTAVDSGYISNKFDKQSKQDQDINNNMVQTKLNSKNTRCQIGMDFDLASFWTSAESPYWPCKRKTLQKLDVDCLYDTNEDFLKHVIRKVYYAYQKSAIRVDGTTDHIAKQIEDILTAQTNDSLVSSDNEIILFDVGSKWNAQVFTDDGFKKDVGNKIPNDKLSNSDTPSLKFTSKTNSQKKPSIHEIVFGKDCKLKQRLKKSTFINLCNDNLFLTFHFTE